MSDVSFKGAYTSIIHKTTKTKNNDDLPVISVWCADIKKIGNIL